MTYIKTIYYKGKAYKLEANKPVKSYLKNKKYMVYVAQGGKKKLIHFGDTKYMDYRQHKDEKRREGYLMRSSGIKYKNGKYTKDDPFSPNYWSMRYLWGYKGHKLLTK